MKIALAQINPIVGDITGNANLIGHSIDQAREMGARLVVFPELSIIGYPPKDLLLKPAVIDQCVAAVTQLAERCRDVAAIIGYPCPAGDQVGRALHNACAFCHQGQIVHRHVKSLLPSYDVFDEQRYFEPGLKVDLASWENVQLGISICEDLWNDQELLARQLYHDNPIRDLAEQGASLFINCSASPFVLHKHAFRLKLFRSAAKKHRLPLLYCNQVGGNDELVFDGNSCAFDGDGQLIAHAKDFKADLLLVDLPLHNSGGSASLESPGLDPRQVSRIESPRNDIESVFHALVLGLRDYCRKCRFKSIVMGLSGGIDSSVTAALAVAALGHEHVRGVAMPSRFSSEGSIQDATELANRLGIPLTVTAIEEAHRAFEKLLSPHFDGRPPDMTEENVQARIRGLILMAMSNKFGALLVTTGNKSELAVGYCTLYGDMCGGLAILSDVPKTMAWELARWINTSNASPLRKRYGGPVIPENAITKPPSAELRPDQTDQETLPPYDVLDDIIERYVEREESTQQIVDQTGYEADIVLDIIRRIDLNEYKRKQAAPGIKVTGRAFGFGRRMPIAQQYDNGQSWKERGTKSE